MGVLPRGRNGGYGRGLDLNDTDVVGSIATAWSSSQRAARWDSRQRLQDLMSTYFPSGWSDTTAQGVNNGGDFVGTGYVSGQGRAWLLR